MQGTTDYVSANRDDIPDLALLMFEKHFGSVTSAMVLLLQCVSGGEDWGKVFFLFDMIGSEYSVVFIFYVVFFLLSFFNITTSLFVDQALKLSRPDHESRMLEKWREDIKAAADLRTMIANMDKDKSGKVTREEW